MQTNSRTAIGAIFTAIHSLMLTLVGLLKVADEGTEMLHTAVINAKERQETRTVYDMEIFHKTYEAEAAKRLTESRLALEAYAQRSDLHREGYEAALRELREAMQRHQESKKAKYE